MFRQFHDTRFSDHEYCSTHYAFITVGALPSTPSSNPSTTNPKGKEATSESAGTPGAINDNLQLSGHDPELAKLKARDREVRAHEAAHTAAAGS